MKYAPSVIAAAFVAIAVASPSHAGDKVVGGPVRSIPRASVGLEPRGDHLHGGGADYKARFDAQGFTFVPALGRAVEHEQSLHFALRSAGREHGPALALDLAAAPSVDGISAVYERAALVERYALSSAGVEQSFEIAAPPAGDGDLVVRGAFASTLPRTEAVAGLRFATHEHGGVSIGAVTGIDALGRSVQGSLALADGELELRLPDAFVDQAAWPVLVDPLFGTVFGVSAGANDDSSPDVANEASNNTYVVTWQRDFSSASSEIRAQRVQTDGNLAGGTIFVSSGGYNAHPSIAGNTLTNAMLIAWQTAGNVFGPYNVVCRNVDTNTGILSAATLPLASDPGNEIDPVVGGEAIKLIALDKQEVLVVWAAESFGIKGAQVRIPAGAGDPSVVSTFTVATDTPTEYNLRPAITKHGADEGVHLVVWQRRPDLLIGPSDLHAQMVSRYGVLIGPPAVVADTAFDERDAAVDSMPDGAAFVIAYEREEADLLGHDVYARSLIPSNGVLTSGAGPVAIDADDDDEESDPAVICPGAKAWIAYCDQTTFANSTIRVEAFDPKKLVQCEDVVFAQPTGIAQKPALAYVYAAYLGGVQSLLTWSVLDEAPPFPGDIHAQLLLTHAGTGTTQDLGGGCGGGGTLSNTFTPDIGSGLFLLSCTGIDPGAFKAILNFNLPTPPLSCGSCAWVPFFLPIGQTIQVPGSAAFLTPIPCDPALIGGQLDAQFTSFLTSGSPCSLFPNVSLSNRLRLTFGQ
ncbi:MAG: hypothetical protein EPO68_04540 [Planctomycetota bacterium]|nr:MAG: hypothetical protein EPO68_04540 [Planctomycetota bacterium]